MSAPVPSPSLSPSLTTLATHEVEAASSFSFLLQIEEDIGPDGHGSHDTYTVASFPSEAVAIEAARAIAVMWDERYLPGSRNVRDSLPDFFVARIPSYDRANPLPFFSMDDNTTIIWSYQDTWRAALMATTSNSAAAAAKTV